MKHATPEELSAQLDGALDPVSRERLARHLAECADCRAALAELAAQEAALRPILEHDPGDAYFETFAARVEDRIRAAGLGGAQARLAGGGWLGWLSSPRRLAWAGAAVAVIAGAGIVMLTTRPQRSPLQNPELAQRAEQGAETGRARKERERTAHEAGADQGVPLGAALPTAPAPGAKVQKTGPPATGSVPSGATRESNAAQEEMTRSAPEATAKAASPQRAMEVRRSASGEDVPVAKDELRYAAPPPAPGATGDLKAAKPRAAQPMEQQQAERPSLAPSTPTLGRSGEAQLCGRIVDTRDRPVPGATVALADQGRVATAGADGRFCMNAAAGLHELTVMAVGYEPARLQVRVEGESSEALVTLRGVSVLDRAADGLGLRGGREAEIDAFRKLSAAGGGLSPAAAAARLSARAESLHSAVAFDTAATAWARVAGQTRGASWLEARYRAAEARYRAWQLGPTAARARMARDALDAYLTVAPAGSRRNQISAWRRQIGR